MFWDKPWWKDKEKGWPYKGVGDFFNEAERLLNSGDANTAIEVLEWGKRFSVEAGSGGGAHRFDEAIALIRSKM